MTKETMTGPVSGEVGRGYDKFMRVATLTVNGAATSYSYDNDGLLIGAGDITLTRDPQTGFLTGTALGAITDAYTYSTFGETSNYNAKIGGADLFNVQYTRDAIGRITTKTETIGGATGATTTVYEYGYDLAGRLVSVKENGVTVSTYDYDANGNRITAVTKAGTFQGFYDLQDRMTKYGDADYTYTANGELKTKTDSAGATTYNYDVFGALRSVTMPNGDVIEYVIDGADRRVGKKVNGALAQGFIYKNQLEPVAELDGAGNVVSRFVYASRSHVPDYMTKGGVTYRIISDHLGSVRLVINASDNSIAQHIDYDEFGNVLADSNPGFQPFAFAGGIYDQHTKLTRFGARDYDAVAGRWTEKDIILFIGSKYNIYIYSSNNPINKTDQTGLFGSELDFPNIPSPSPTWDDFDPWRWFFPPNQEPCDTTPKCDGCWVVVGYGYTAGVGRGILGILDAASGQCVMRWKCMYKQPSIPMYSKQQYFTSGIGSLSPRRCAAKPPGPGKVCSFNPNPIANYED